TLSGEMSLAQRVESGPEAGFQSSANAGAQMRRARTMLRNMVMVHQSEPQRHRGTEKKILCYLLCASVSLWFNAELILAEVEFDRVLVERVTQEFLVARRTQVETDVFVGRGEVGLVAGVLQFLEHLAERLEIVVGEVVFRNFVLIVDSEDFHFDNIPAVG